MGGGGIVGDWFQTIADVQAKPQAADTLAADVLGWLISSGIVSAERTDCVLGSDLGYPPGPRVDDVVDASGWSGRWQDGWTNGLDIITGGTIFHSGQGGPDAVTCPHCLVNIELDDEAWERFDEVLNGWAEGRDVVIPCPACTRPVTPTSWKWAEDYFALGHLGFKFWNWPPMRAEFVAEFTRHLGGHRVVLLAGKL
jgi:hypothetical protein